ncbi:MAG: DUF3592 domain-containing protein [Erythrobacter sp.]|nr:DUF3592 domain-containing protein [Erythrobacter sp.]
MGPKGVFGGLFLLIGGFFFCVGGYALVDANLIAMNGVRTTGQIAGYDTIGNRRKLAFTFTARTGETFRGHFSRAWTKTGPLRLKRLEAELDVGRPVPVIYDPADPQRSVADTFMGRFGALLHMLVVLPFMLMGAYFLRSDRREQIEDGWVQRRF